MGTLGNFSYLYPDDEAYIEGKPLEEWVEDNIDWLMEVFEQHGIPLTSDLIEFFYQAVNDQDWRCSSCGGCI